MVTTEKIETCVIGAGVVGLAIARELALRGQEVLVLEKHSRYGEGVSSRNSEVIHAGLYYPTGSLKATQCVKGKAMLYQYCVERGISYRRIGKLIVATTPDEEEVLSSIKDKAYENGVDGLSYLSKDILARAEPELDVSMALHSPSTGIVSCAELMTALLGDVESAGGVLACQAEVTRIESLEPGFRVHCEVENDAFAFECRHLVNSAGLGAQKVAASIDGLDTSHIPPLYFCKGNYLSLSGKSPFHHLIYPVPDPTGAGLGVHATLDTGGQVKFGPDVEYIDKEDYAVSSERMTESVAAIRRYYPGLNESALQPAYAGIRPKLQGPGDPPQDFLIQDANTHRIEGLINLFGIESPGLTSSMALAETVAEQLAATTA